MTVILRKVRKSSEWVGIGGASGWLGLAPDESDMARRFIRPLPDAPFDSAERRHERWMTRKTLVLRPQRTLFSSTFNAYIGSCRGDPAMAINARRNKPF